MSLLTLRQRWPSLSETRGQAKRQPKEAVIAEKVFKSSGQRGLVRLAQAVNRAIVAHNAAPVEPDDPQPVDGGTRRPVTKLRKRVLPAE